MKLQKITNQSIAGPRRSYGDACASAHALDLVGERWALLVMREMMLGPKRFSDLRAGLPGISANVLTQRLEWLEAIGIVVRRDLPPPAAARVYDLTDWGRESEPIFHALGRWAARSPHPMPGPTFSAAAFLLSLRAMLDPGRAAGMRARIGFVLGMHPGAECHLAELADGRLEIRPGPTTGADLVLTGAPPALAAAIYDGQALEALEAGGEIRIAGDRDLARRFVTLFPLPPKASLPPGASLPSGGSPPAGAGK